MRILVLWNACRGIAPLEDADWARERTLQLGTCDVIASLALHAVSDPAGGTQPTGGWCLELHLAAGRSPRELVRRRTWAEFIGDLRLLGMRPRVLAIPDEHP